MKLRIKDNSLRYRLTKSEVEQLYTQGEVTGQTEFHTGQSIFFYRLVAADLTHPCAEFKGGGITVHLPDSLLKEWATTDQVGISYTQENDEDEGLKILIEKDFVCMVTREDEDPNDLYPNPNR